MPVYYKGFKIKKEADCYITNKNNKVCAAKSYSGVKKIINGPSQYSNDYNCLYKEKTTGEELAEIYSKFFVGGRKQ